MKQTYSEAIAKVFKDEGGYTNDKADPGGPTNWGITIADARMYWKKDATAGDVRSMPKSVAEDIYRKHYATPLNYDYLPAGVDYTVLDYGINSGIGRSKKVLANVQLTKKDPKDIINAIYDERLAFLKRLHTWPTFGKGWERRCVEGRALALSLADKYGKLVPPKPISTEVSQGTGIVAVIMASIAAVYEWGQEHPIAVVSGIAGAAFVTYLLTRRAEAHVG